MLRDLIKNAKVLGISLEEACGARLLLYLELLQKWNKIHNLCAKANDTQMLSYHILDSLSLVANISCANKTILDVGTGAGLPGIPLAIVVSSGQVTLLDSKEKKIAFINYAINNLKLSNARSLGIRVEQFRTDYLFDMVVSRAFADLFDFVKVASRLCSEQGIIVAMKSDPAPYKVGVKIFVDWYIKEVKNVLVPGVKSPRSLVIISKQ